MRNNFIFSPRKFCTLCILLKFSLQAGQFFIQNISFFLYLYAARTNHLTFQNSEKVSQAKIKRSLCSLAVFHVPEDFMFANCFILKHTHHHFPTSKKIICFIFFPIAFVKILFAIFHPLRQAYCQWHLFQIFVTAAPQFQKPIISVSVSFCHMKRKPSNLVS